MKIFKIFCEEYRSFNLIGKIVYLSALIMGIISIVLFWITFISQSEIFLSISAYSLGIFVTISSICATLKFKNLKCLFVLLLAFLIILYGITH